MIDKTIKNIKKYLILWREHLQQKHQKKNTLQGFGGNTYSKNSKYNFFLSFLCIKGLDIKMVNITINSYLKCDIEIIDKRKYFWINRKDLEIESDVANWAMIFDKCDPEK